MIPFNDLLRQTGLDPAQVTVMLHTPTVRGLAQMLPHLAEADPEVFNTYQSVHAGPATATLRGRPFMASFVRVDSGTLALAGVYAVKSVQSRARTEISDLPAVQRLISEFGTLMEFQNPATDSVWDWFDLELTDHLAALRGRVQIRPNLTRAYVRLADTLDAQIMALSETSVLTTAMPDWRDLSVGAAGLQRLPPLWRTTLSQWRGVYLICDQTDGARYVGSAYGADNLLGRWSEHVAGPNGITTGLKLRETRNFRFSILERVSPDMSAQDVINLENTWKVRLQTREFGLNEN